MRKSSAIKNEIAKTEADQREAQVRVTELEAAGDASSKAIAEHGQLTGKTRLLTGAIKRLHAELEAAVIREQRAELNELTKLVTIEERAGETALAELTAKAVKLLVPDVGTGAFWTALNVERRMHELSAFSSQHPSVSKHTEAVQTARARLVSLRKKLAAVPVI